MMKAIGLSIRQDTTHFKWAIFIWFLLFGIIILFSAGCILKKYEKLFYTNGETKQVESNDYMISADDYYFEYSVSSYYGKLYLNTILVSKGDQKLIYYTHDITLKYYKDDIPLFRFYINNKNYKNIPDSVIVDDSCKIFISFMVSSKQLTGLERFNFHLGKIRSADSGEIIDLGEKEFYHRP